jgi:hypothetical protein
MNNTYTYTHIRPHTDPFPSYLLVCLCKHSCRLLLRRCWVMHCVCVCVCVCVVEGQGGYTACPVFYSQLYPSCRNFRLLEFLWLIFYHCGPGLLTWKNLSRLKILISAAANFKSQPAKLVKWTQQCFLFFNSVYSFTTARSTQYWSTP